MQGPITTDELDSVANLPVTADDQFLSDYTTANSDDTTAQDSLKGTLAKISGDDNEADVDAQIADIDKRIAHQSSAQVIQQLQDERDKLVASKKLATLQDKTDKAGIQTERSEERNAQAEYVRQEKLRQQQLSNQQKLQGLVNDKVVTPASNAALNVAGKVSSLPTVGSIGLLLVILIVLLFVVVNVDGKGTTRIKQLWYMLNGRAHITNRVQVTKGSQGGTPSDSVIQGTTGVSANTPVLSGNAQQNAFQTVQNDIGNSNLNALQQAQPGILGLGLQKDILSGASATTLDNDFQSYLNVIQAANSPASLKADLHTFGDDISFHGNYGDF
jgi:hypothetical protein